MWHFRKDLNFSLCFSTEFSPIVTQRFNNSPRLVSKHVETGKAGQKIRYSNNINTDWSVLFIYLIILLMI